MSPTDDEVMIKLTQEGRYSPIQRLQYDTQWQEEGSKPNSISLKMQKASELTEKEDQCSPCWADEEPSPPQLHYPGQTWRGSPVEVPLPLGSNAAHMPLPLGSNTAHMPLLTNNCSAPLTHQRKATRRKVKGKKSTKRITENGTSQNRKVTDFFPIRRSSRKSKAEIKCEQKQHIDHLITNGIEEGMEVQHIEGKGRGVFATQCFQKGEYIVEYHGDLLHITDAKKREAEYSQNPATGCYMYYFQHLCKTYCVDATKETGRMGRLINHSSKNGNCQTKLHDINGVPHLILVASRNVAEGEELLYDYGDRSKDSIAAHPWLKY